MTQQINSRKKSSLLKRRVILGPLHHGQILNVPAHPLQGLLVLPRREKGIALSMRMSRLVSIVYIISTSINKYESSLANLRVAISAARRHRWVVALLQRTRPPRLSHLNALRRTLRTPRKGHGIEWRR